MYDALVIGGGPGGSCTSTYLARAGKRVLVLEREHFPRFHIGESLLPYNMAIFREMGVLPKLQEMNFPRKQGAQFQLGNGTKGTKFTFRFGVFNQEPEAIQVERSIFDHILLKHAAASGAEVREGWTVHKFSVEKDGVTIEASSDTGIKETFRGKYLLDASGRMNFTGNQEGLRVIHPNLKKLAVFGHFHHVNLDPGEKGGDTVIVRLHNKWFWIIPISAEKTSVGCVMDRDEFAASKATQEEIFNGLVQSSKVMRARMSRAELVGPMRTLADFSYYNKRLVGPRLLRIGDAAGFMDPIFSAGVYLAMFSGKHAALTVLELLKDDRSSDALLRKYAKRVDYAMHFYWEMVENYYTTPFMEVFLNPRPKWNLPSAVNAVLAGELDGKWSMRWRLRLFFWLVKLQGIRPFLPKVSFEETESTPQKFAPLSESRD